jgi:methylmalonyl-CoA mutase, N-terminal domain
MKGAASPHKGFGKRKSVYGPDDIADLDYHRDLGDPGVYPYARGIHPEMFRNRLWTMRQYAGFGTAEVSNRRFRLLLERGTTGLSVAFDLPTQVGLDSDHPLAEGEVGRVGVAVDSLEDMEALFDRIPLGRVSTSMTINATAAILLALYLVLAEKGKADWARLRGTVQNDILKEYVARGTYIFPPEPSLRLVTDLIAFCRSHAPRWNPISVSGYHLREAGATALQELAFTIANGEAYLRAAVAAGAPAEETAAGFSFFFSAHNDLFEEVAKFRAARRVWARLLRDRFGVWDPRALAMRFHVQTAGSTLTAGQPDTNVVRVTLQALAGVLGGTQSLHANGKDEALALPSASAATLALRTQQILAHESGVAGVADPLGGSWYVERLTCDFVEAAEACLDEVRARGGALRALEEGFFQRAIQESAYAHQREVESEERIVVGVNRYVEKEETAAVEIDRPDPTVRVEQAARLRDLRGRRDGAAVQKALDQIRRTAAGRDNVLPELIQAVRNLATVGEMAAALGDVFGEHRETVVF